MRRLDIDPASVPDGTLVPVQVDGVSYVVAHHALGWCMFRDECTHASCRFSENGEIVDGTVLVCNCHGAEFDLVTGEVLELPAEIPLDVRPLHVDGNGLSPA
jgi:3-phenylpropionate/trans-cinnamate dioxygenase ferredoxin subunit